MARALLVGATGLVGRELLQRLLWKMVISLMAASVGRGTPTGDLGARSPMRLQARRASFQPPMPRLSQPSIRQVPPQGTNGRKVSIPVKVRR